MHLFWAVNPHSLKITGDTFPTQIRQMFLLRLLTHMTPLN